LEEGGRECGKKKEGSGSSVSGVYKGDEGPRHEKTGNFERGVENSNGAGCKTEDWERAKTLYGFFEGIKKGWGGL